MAELQFAYDAYGVGLSGIVGNRVIPARLIAALPQTGGFSGDELSDFRSDAYLTVADGFAGAAGEFDAAGASWNSQVKIHLGPCVLMDQIRVDHIELSLQAKHSREGGPPVFSTLGSRISGLFIRDQPVEIVMEADLDFSTARLPGSMVSRLRAAEPLLVSGNTISVPGLGRIRIAEMEVKRDRIRLVMITAELDNGEVRGQVTLASASLGGHLVRLPDEPADTRTRPEMAPEPELAMDEDDFEDVLTELRAWAASHPEPREPFMAFMGRVLTPVEFLVEVEARTRIGKGFLSYLVEESRRTDEPPRKMIRRAVEANRP